MKKKELLRRRRQLALRLRLRSSNDEWLGSLLTFQFLDGRRRGRPKLSQASKDEAHQKKISPILNDIWKLNLTTIKSEIWIAKRLHAKFPDKYPIERKTQTGKTVKSSLRRDVADALKYLRENAGHPNMHPGFLRLLKAPQKQLAK